MPDITTGFSLFFIVFQCGFGESSAVRRLGAVLKKLRHTAETGRFYAGLPVLGSAKKDTDFLSEGFGS
ncbi:MAG: hypothetical protein LBN39_05465 [Planctomycetaceae bacterium]|nr:hypothetical protein [Planctomycetaceae bacterium]